MKKFVTKNLIIIITIVFALAGTGGAFACINSHSADRGENTIYGENAEAMNVFPEGKGYHLSKQQAMMYQLPEKLEPAKTDEEAEAEAAAGNETGTLSSAINSIKNKIISKLTASSKPTITSNLTSLATSKRYEAGDDFEFYVEGYYTYTKGSKLKKVKLTEKNIVVKYGDKVVHAADNTGKRYFYELEVDNDSLKVTITAKNPKAEKKNTTKISAKIMSKGNTGYNVKVSMNLTAIKDAPSFNGTIKCDKGTTTTVRKALEKILEDKGYEIDEARNNEVVSIGGFGANTEYTLESDICDMLEEDGFVDGESYFSSIETDYDGAISNGDFFPQDSHWVITNGSGEVMYLNDEISSKTTLKLDFYVYDNQ